jgi:hypothetical protein
MLFLRNLEMNNSIGWSKKYALHPPWRHGHNAVT